VNLELLQQVTFLAGLAPEDIQKFATLLTERTVNRGDRVVTEGEPIDSLSIVCSGTVHVRRTVQDKEVLLGRIEPGGFFGEINLYDPAGATASVYAMGEVTLASIDYGTFRSFMDLNPAVGYKIVSSLMAETARRLRQTDARLVSSVYWAGAR
jgi:CRP-like cAMP-binding protein